MISSNPSFHAPRRGEIWDVNFDPHFDPAFGAEIKKQRPAVIISSDSVGKLPLKLIVPITEWKDVFEHNIWHVRIPPDQSNGLIKVSAADALQARGVDVARLIKKRGRLTATVVEEIAAALAAVIEYQ